MYVNTDNIENVLYFIYVLLKLKMNTDKSFNSSRLNTWFFNFSVQVESKVIFSVQSGTMSISLQLTAIDAPTDAL